MNLRKKASNESITSNSIFSEVADNENKEITETKSKILEVQNHKMQAAERLRVGAELLVKIIDAKEEIEITKLLADLNKNEKNTENNNDTSQNEDYKTLTEQIDSLSKILVETQESIRLCEEAEILLNKKLEELSQQKKAASSKLCM